MLNNLCNLNLIKYFKVFIPKRYYHLTYTR